MPRQDTKPHSPSHVPGTRKGEEWSIYGTEPGRESGENSLGKKFDRDQCQETGTDRSADASSDTPVRRALR